MNAQLATAADAAKPTYALTADGTTNDHNLGLQWSKTLCDANVSHHAAAKLIEALNEGVSDGEPKWRFPTIQEGLALVRYDRISPACDTEFFPDMKSDWYWMGDLYAGNSDFAWIVSFYNGNSVCLHRGVNGAFVRAVRELPASQCL